MRKTKNGCFILVLFKMSGLKVNTTNNSIYDLFVTHVEIRDCKASRCNLDTQTPEQQYIQDRDRSPLPSDQITAYIFGRSVHADEGSYCVEIPYAPSCYMRVPEFWQTFSNQIQSQTLPLLSSYRMDLEKYL